MISTSAVENAGFEIIEPAPASGTASVYKARHLSTGVLCALKIANEKAGGATLARETSLLQQLNHRSIIRLFTHGVIESTPYLATRWVNGRRLTEVINYNSPLDADFAIGLYKQLVSAMQHAHDAGVVHADISPANIIVDSNDKVTLLDFGVGCQSRMATVTADSNLTATLRYVAPEVIKGERATAHSDQYSVAVILYEMLCGCWPYDGDSTIASALHSHLYSEAVNVQERNPAVSTVLSQILSKSLSKDPHDRYSSLSTMAKSIYLDEVIERIDNVVEYRSIAPVSINLFGKLAAVVVTFALLSNIIWRQNDSQSMNRASLISQSYADEINPQCNLLQTPETGDDDVVVNFYGPDNLPNRITLSDTVNDQWQLEIGKSNQYGLYGQIVEVRPDQQYQLSANIERQGYVHMPALRIEWLDADYQIQPELLVEYRIEDLKDGQITMPPVQVPGNAAYAVPTVYKDETVGTMTVTTMSFSAVDCK